VPSRTVPKLPLRTSKHESLQPPGWPAPKGYANGIKAKGEFVFVGGMVGWDAKEKFPKGFVPQSADNLTGAVHLALTDLSAALATLVVHLANLNYRWRLSSARHAACIQIDDTGSATIRQVSGTS